VAEIFRPALLIRQPWKFPLQPAAVLLALFSASLAPLRWRMETLKANWESVAVAATRAAPPSRHRLASPGIAWHLHSEIDRRLWPALLIYRWKNIHQLCGWETRRKCTDSDSIRIERHATYILIWKRKWWRPLNSLLFDIFELLQLSTRARFLHWHANVKWWSRLDYWVSCAVSLVCWLCWWLLDYAT